MVHVLKTILLFSLLLASNQHVCAQKEYFDIVDSTLTIERDSRLDSLLIKHRRVNGLKDGFDGYRVQLFSGSGTEARNQANDLRAEFMTLYPNVPAYLIYQAPNFKVRIGDFRTELEAIRLQRELSYQYPGGFVARDLIKFPRLTIEQEVEEIESELETDPSED